MPLCFSDQSDRDSNSCLLLPPWCSCDSAMDVALIMGKALVETANKFGPEFHFERFEHTLPMHLGLGMGLTLLPTDFVSGVTPGPLTTPPLMEGPIFELTSGPLTTPPPMEGLSFELPSPAPRSVVPSSPRLLQHGWTSGPINASQRVLARPFTVVSPRTIGQMRAATTFRPGNPMPMAAPAWQPTLDNNTNLRSASEILGGAPLFRTHADVPRGPAPMPLMGLPFSCPPPPLLSAPSQPRFLLPSGRCLPGPPPGMAGFLGNPYGAPFMSRLPPTLLHSPDFPGGMNPDLARQAELLFTSPNPSPFPPRKRGRPLGSKNRKPSMRKPHSPM